MVDQLVLVVFMLGFLVLDMTLYHKVHSPEPTETYMLLHFYTDEVGFSEYVKLRMFYWNSDGNIRF